MLKSETLKFQQAYHTTTTNHPRTAHSAYIVKLVLRPFRIRMVFYIPSLGRTKNLGFSMCTFACKGVIRLQALMMCRRSCRWGTAVHVSFHWLLHTEWPACNSRHRHKLFFSAYCLDHFWGPYIFISNGHKELFPRNRHGSATWL